MPYDFDTVIDRRGTGSLKWERYAGREVLPLWVADMDFASAPEIIDALRERLDHRVLGYTVPTREAEEAALDYLREVHGYRAERSWLCWMHGMVPGLNVAARGFTEAGQNILTATPIYPPFLLAPGWQGATVQGSHLIREGGTWTFDFDDLEAKVSPETRMFWLCSPHNPTGTVFTRPELERLAEFCLRHQLVLLSDEIHCDLLIDDVKHLCTATLSPEVDEQTITFLAPSKTYNLPGLACAYAVIRNPTIRARFQRAARGFVTEVNPFGYAGLTAAYRHGEPWRQALCAYLKANRDYLYAFVQEHLPEITLHPMQATYLAWLNVEGIQALGVENPHAYLEEHGVGLSPGADFGDSHYLRLNFGCPRKTLQEALQRIRQAVHRLRSKDSQASGQHRSAATGQSDD